MSKRASITIAAFVLALAMPAIGLGYGLCGYDWTYKANPMGENYKINPNCVDAAAGTAQDQIDYLVNGFTEWNTTGNAVFSFVYGGTSSGTSVTYNNTNLIYFDTTPPDGGGYIAANYHWISGGNMSESDIVMNDQGYTWNGVGNPTASQMDIWNIGTHELGHTLCLLDLYGGGDSAKTMYGYGSYGQTSKRTLHSDDIAGIQAIYGTASSNTAPDLTTGYVTPTTGGLTTTFEFFVNYFDADGDSPSSINVYIDSVPYAMGLVSGSSSNGTYKKQLTLGEGTHNYYFSCSDGNGGSDRLPASGTYSGPTVSGQTVEVTITMEDRVVLPTKFLDYTIRVTNLTASAQNVDVDVDVILYNNTKGKDVLDENHTVPASSYVEIVGRHRLPPRTGAALNLIAGAPLRVRATASQGGGDQDSADGAFTAMIPDDTTQIVDARQDDLERDPDTSAEDYTLPNYPNVAGDMVHKRFLIPEGIDRDFGAEIIGINMSIAEFEGGSDLFTVQITGADPGTGLPDFSNILFSTTTNSGYYNFQDDNLTYVDTTSGGQGQEVDAFDVIWVTYIATGGAFHSVGVDNPFGASGNGLVWYEQTYFTDGNSPGTTPQVPGNWVCNLVIDRDNAPAPSPLTGGGFSAPEPNAPLGNHMHRMIEDNRISSDVPAVGDQSGE